MRNPQPLPLASTTPDQTLRYSPSGPTIKAFMESSAFVRGIMGPLGSGKSTACVLEILRRAQMQIPSPVDGVRRTRWAIIRNTYPELKTTTLKTWAQWCPTSYGKLNMDSPITHHIRAQGFELEVLFLALDRDEDVKKLLSLELTGAWINEAREIPKSIIDALTGRVGRYPAKNQGGASWSGIIMDTNPPDDQSFWYLFAEGETPKGWAFFQQPGGLSEGAENIENLPNDYYGRIASGKDPDWVKVYVDGEYGFVTEGKAVYPMYRDRMHTSGAGRIDAIYGLPIMIGVDFGLTPAAVIGQKLTDGRWHILDELVTDNTGTVRFAETLKKYMASVYPVQKIDGCFGDPAGATRGSNDERTALEIMEVYTGWKWRAAPGDNNLDMRKEVVIAALNRLIDGNPGFLLSPNCEVLRKGFAGGYHYKFISSSTGNRVHDKPNKNKYSHPHDALQYLLLGGGEHDVVLGKAHRRRGTRSKMPEGHEFDVYSSKDD